MTYEEAAEGAEVSRHEVEREILKHDADPALFYAERENARCTPHSRFWSGSGTSSTSKQHSQVVRKVLMAWVHRNKQLVSEGMPQSIRARVMQFITQRKNGIISGDEGSGKGVLLVALVGDIPQEERVLVIETPVEIRGQHPNVVRLPVTGKAKDTHTSATVLAAALDHDPHHTVVGYIHTEADYRLLRAVNEQHGGTLSTMHATSAGEALDRLRQLAMSAEPDTHPARLASGIAKEIDFILHCEHDSAGRKRVASLVAVTGYDAARNEFETEELYRASDAHAA